jgi:tRNA(Ile)-lysidine synthase
MDTLLVDFQDALQKLGIVRKHRLLLAVSGGLDSVVLTELCVLAGLKFSIVHANFHLRGEESDRDENFVRSLAEKYNSKFYSKDLDATQYANTRKCSIQVAARELRYNWFKTFIGNEADKYQFLFTAHHLDDNIETILMHFFRGTGLSGLKGIPKRNEYVIRPLLDISKKKLKLFASARNLEWVEDSTNAADDYTRNYFRNQLIPSLQTVFPEIEQNLARNLNRFAEANILYHQAILQYKKKLLRVQGEEIHIPILLLKKSVPTKTIIYEILKDYQFSSAQTEEVIRLLDSANGKYISSPTHRIIKDRRWLIIAPLTDLHSGHFIIEKGETIFDYPEGRLRFSEVERNDSGIFKGNGNSEYLALDEIRFPLILRKWKAGDYFYPLGMKKKKKVARFLIDQKLSRTAKEKIWVLVSDLKILWVIGQRVDDRFGIVAGTRKLMKVSNEGRPGQP